MAKTKYTHELLEITIDGEITFSVVSHEAKLPPYSGPEKIKIVRVCKFRYSDAQGISLIRLFPKRPVERSIRESYRKLDEVWKHTERMVPIMLALATIEDHLKQGNLVIAGKEVTTLSRRELLVRYALGLVEALSPDLLSAHE